MKYLRIKKWMVDKPTRIVGVAFTSGWLMHNVCISLYMDYIGKAAYLRLADEDWISAGFTVPGAIVVGIIATFMFGLTRQVAQGK